MNRCQKRVLARFGLTLAFLAAVGITVAVLVGPGAIIFLVGMGLIAAASAYDFSRAWRRCSK